MNMRIVAGVLSAIVAAVHVAAIIIGEAAYRWLGAGEAMARSAAAGSPTPAMITGILVAIFAAWAWWAFASRAGRKRQQRWRSGMITIGFMYLARGALLVPEAWGFVAGRVPPVLARQLVFSLFALLAGAAYLLGAREGRRKA